MLNNCLRVSMDLPPLEVKLSNNRVRVVNIFLPKRNHLMMIMMMTNDFSLCL